MMTSKYKSLYIENFSIGYNSYPLIDDININISSGKIVGIIGKNGSGKTTLLSSIAGILKPLRGKIFLNNIDITKTSVRERVKNHKFGYLLQNSRTISDLTIRENLHISQYHISRWSKREKNLQNLLKNEPFNKLKPFLDQFSNVLSGGLELLLAFASLKLQNSKIILLDEPSAGLDVENKTMIIHHLKSFRDEGKLVIFVEQMLEVVFDVSDEIHVIKSKESNNRNTLIKLGQEKMNQIRMKFNSNSLSADDPSLEIINLIWEKTGTVRGIV